MSNINTVPKAPAAPTAATVGAASSQIVAVNKARTGLVIINTSANTVSLGLGQAAVLNSGITLNASGGTFEMDSFTYTTSPVFAIASGAGSNVAIQEYS